MPGSNGLGHDDVAVPIWASWPTRPDDADYRQMVVQSGDRGASVSLCRAALPTVC